MRAFARVGLYMHMNCAYVRKRSVSLSRSWKLWYVWPLSAWLGYYLLRVNWKSRLFSPLSRHHSLWTSLQRLLLDCPFIFSIFSMYELLLMPNLVFDKCEIFGKGEFILYGFHSSSDDRFWWQKWLESKFIFVFHVLRCSIFLYWRFLTNRIIMARSGEFHMKG